MNQRSVSRLFFQSILVLVFPFFYSCEGGNEAAVGNSAQTHQEKQTNPKPAETSLSEDSFAPENTASDQHQNVLNQKTENNKHQDQSGAISGKKKQREVEVVEVDPPSITILTQENIHSQDGAVDAGPLLPPQGKGEDEIYDFVTEVPVFPGGEEALKEYLRKNIVYPETERLNGIQGTVYVSFVVEKDSTVSNVVLLRGINGGPGLNKEAIRVVKSLTKFTPGRMGDKIVRTRMNIPVRFKI